jgi:hypothetical protein
MTDHIRIDNNSSPARLLCTNCGAVEALPYPTTVSQAYGLALFQAWRRRHRGCRPRGQVLPEVDPASITAPPCPGCQHWRPEVVHLALGGELVPDGIILCHALEQCHDFSCYRPRPATPETDGSAPVQHHDSPGQPAGQQRDLLVPFLPVRVPDRSRWGGQDRASA